MHMHCMQALIDFHNITIHMQEQEAIYNPITDDNMMLMYAVLLFSASLCTFLAIPCQAAIIYCRRYGKNNWCAQVSHMHTLYIA